ncbi:quinone oxidoreductase family protein [Calothrix sp. NIES-3974]|uniref:quinone oxidoreductase family protein n=1 Tax=Calothrix sp. NIES-3974 TaxID=2005462 RepID=UPI000B5E0A50|nr:quinone oxidoreductase [Calothrix sp. NIES-3974]BAZ06181.1 quinone oxidoreductase [Calothrix sp. NIES-3974]
MKTIQVDEHGDANVLKLAEVEIPKPQAGQALVKIHYAGVNFIDVAMRRGWYPNPPIPTPFTPGVEGAGEVIAIADDVTEVKVGDRVSFMQEEEPGLDRAYAEYIPIAAWKLIPLPDAISFETAAAMTAQGLTTQYMMNEFVNLQPGKSILIHAAAGGMGLNLVQWAKHLGAFAIGTTSNATKAQRVLELGADAVIDYTQEDFVQRVKALTNGKGADLIIDGVGKTTFAGDLEAVATRGHIVTYGITGGIPDDINPFDLLYRSRTVHGADLFDYIANREERIMRANAVWDAIAAGWLKPQISQVFALEETIAAHRLIEDRNNMGKILLKM